MQVKDIVKIFEQFAPLQLQEPYDNSGLCIGNPNHEVTGALIAIDITEPVIDEAMSKKCNLIISHHPLIFFGIKTLTGQNYVERCVIKAIQNNLNIYCSHTNVDVVAEGVSHKMCEKLGLANNKVLSPAKSVLLKLVTFVPIAEAEIVRAALFSAGAGEIGNYGACSFNSKGFGTFKGNENTNPFVGEKNKLHTEEEIKIETIFPKYLQKQIIKALLESHPYEEVAYDIYSLENAFEKVGLGMIGDLPKPVKENDFLLQIKNTFDARGIRYTALLNKPINKVAVCGGSGASLLKNAIAQGADVFVSADFKYHQFFDAEGKILVVDIGHYESEQFTKEIFYHLLIKKFSNFAVHFSEISTNPINYL